MYKPYEDVIRRALEEDGAYDDITTLSTVSELQQVRATFLTRQAGVIAGMDVALRTFRMLDKSLEIKQVIQDGTAVQSDDVLASLYGSARSVLSAERVALNFLGRLSGIATITAQCVQAIEGAQARILDTRKTTPGLRSLEKMAVLMGGGHNHRFGLSDGVLIKDNHIKAAGGIPNAIAGARHMAPHLLKIEVECETLTEVSEAIESRADVILLDNMSIEGMHEAVTLLRREAPHILIEASGNIGTNIERLAAVASTGVDFISLGAITHSAPNFDISLEFA